MGSCRGWIQNTISSAAIFLFFNGCGIFHQPGSDDQRIFSKVFLVDYNTAWQATLDSVRSFDKTKQNRAGGIIQTTWVDNTAERAYTELYGVQKTFIKARYRLTMAVSPGTYKGKPSVKISVEKEQQIQRDPLEGWKTARTDAIDENTLLYRISRIIYMKLKIQKIEEQKIEEAMKSVKDGNSRSNGEASGNSDASDSADKSIDKNIEENKDSSSPEY